MKSCPYCGHEVLKTDCYCPECGHVSRLQISLDKYNLGLIENFKQCLVYKYADFDGRARRREYWGYVLFYSIIAFAFIFIDILLDLGLILPKIVSLIFALPSLAVSVRRLHDVGKPGYYILAGLIPILGAFYLLFLFIEDSESEENAYGPNPKSL